MGTTQTIPLDAEGDAEVEVDSAAEPEALVDRLETIGQHVGTFVRERPLAAVGIALFAGFLIGRMVR